MILHNYVFVTGSTNPGCYFSWCFRRFCHVVGYLHFRLLRFCLSTANRSWPWNPIVSPPCISTFAGYCSLNSNGVAVLAKCSNVRIVISSAQLALAYEVLLQCILAKALGQHKFHSFTKQEFGCFYGRIHSYFESLIGLPWDKHAAPSILSRVSWPVFSALLPPL